MEARRDQVLREALADPTSSAVLDAVMSIDFTHLSAMDVGGSSHWASRFHHRLIIHGFAGHGAVSLSTS